MSEEMVEIYRRMLSEMAVVRAVSDRINGEFVWTDDMAVLNGALFETPETYDSMEFSFIRHPNAPVDRVVEIPSWEFFEVPRKAYAPDYGL